MIIIVEVKIVTCVGFCQVRNASSGVSGSGHAATSTTNGTSNHTSGPSVGTIPQSLDQLLERQWEQGSQFLMEQAQHFDSKK